MVSLFWFARTEIFQNKRYVLKGRPKFPNRISEQKMYLPLETFLPLSCLLKRAHADIFVPACTLFNEQDKGSNLLSIITWSVLGPVHTYPDIFESATFSFRIQKFLRPHVAYSNRIHPSTRMVSGFTLVPKAKISPEHAP